MQAKLKSFLSLLSHRAIFVCLVSFITSALAEEFSLELKQGDLINFYANKKNIYEKNKQKIIQAEGNIVIIHQNSTIYGDECLMNFATGQLEIHGNVRFISKDVTLYGTDVTYNSNNQNFTVDNAKLFAAKYSLVAKKIHRIDEENYLADYAEFSTCLDCPESWSIYATRIKLTINNYVRAKNAMLKIKGSDFLYLPYIVFPIKRGRETGLLFPKIATRFDQGFYYEQPFFWNISPYQDLTTSPAFWTKRGYSNKLEYRWNYDYNSWFKLDNTYMFDRIYVPNKDIYSPGHADDKTDREYLRYFQNYDFGYRPSHNFGFQMNYTDFRDLDMFKDFHNDLKEKVPSAETGLDAFAFWRTNWSEVNIQTLMPNSLLRRDEESDEKLLDRDPNTVATLPKVSLDIPTQQWKWANSSFFSSMNWKMDMETETFIQNHMRNGPGERLRNARRTILSPQLNLPWWNGEVVQFSSSLNQDYINYNFRNSDAQNFNKTQVREKTSLSFEFGKIYGVATVAKDLPKEEELEDENNNEKEKNKLKSDDDDQLITSLPSWQKKIDDEKKVKLISSYRHVSQIELNHYYLLEERLRGNNDFLNQVSNSNGWFDYHDALLDYDYDVASEAFQTTIPTRNTVELAWNNQLIQKTPTGVDFSRDFYYNPQQFSFGKVAYLNFSQGVRLNNRSQDTSFNGSLTRLMSQVGTSLNPMFAIGLTDYYFHVNHKHIVNINLNNTFSRLRLGHIFSYNEFNNRESYNFNVEYEMNDIATFTYAANYDLKLERKLYESIGLNYKSSSRCWVFDIIYFKPLNQDGEVRFGFNFYFGDQVI